MENQKFKNFKSIKLFLIIFLIFIILALIFADIILFEKSNKQGIVSFKPITFNNNYCPNSCLSEIRNATASAKIVSEVTPTVVPPKLLPATPTSVPIPQIKEIFIPFGSGTSSSIDWQDIGGLKVTINSTNYPTIKSAVFESSINIPTGNETINVRLFNETDKHAVWFSDVSAEGGIPQLLISKPITFDLGNKTYKVQMKTSLGYQAILNEARIHIIFE